MIALMLTLLLLQTMVASNELCNDDKWNIIKGEWKLNNYSATNCTLDVFNEHYNETMLIWFNETETDSYSYYNQKFFTLELVFKMNIDLSKANWEDVPFYHTGLIWYASILSDLNGGGEAYFVGVTAKGGGLKFMVIQQHDSQKYMKRTSDQSIVSFINITHTLKLKAIGSIFRFYLDDQFKFEAVHTQFDHGTIGIGSKSSPATYYSLTMTINNISTLNIEYDGIIHCNDSINDTMRKYEMSHYKFSVDGMNGNKTKIIFKSFGTLLTLKYLEIYIFDADFGVIVDCKADAKCDEWNDDNNTLMIDTLNAGNYIIVIGGPSSDYNNEPYNVSIICQEPKIYVLDEDVSNEFHFVGEIWPITTLLITLCIVIILIPVLYCYFDRKKKKGTFPETKQMIGNGLAVIISIGKYDQDGINNGDISDGYFTDIPVEKDVNNLQNLFKILNYKIMPEELKTHWKEYEVIRYLGDTVGPEISKIDSNGKLIYDGLIVCISCHGIRNSIVTSDYRTIEKTVLHRIISISYPNTRNIPRIFLFDSCEGSAERVKSLIRAPTICIEQFTMENKKESDGVNDEEYGKRVKQQSIFKQFSSPKGIELKDISSERDWKESQPNPDYKLAQIHGANPGFQCKFNSKKGSYLLYEFTQKMSSNLLNNENKTLGDILQEIQNELHDSGKELIINVFNNCTQFIHFKKNEQKELDLSEKGKSTNEGYRSVDNEEDLSEDEDVLKETLIDVLRMPSIVTGAVNSNKSS